MKGREKGPLDCIAVHIATVLSFIRMKNALTPSNGPACEPGARHLLLLGVSAR